MQQQDEFAGVPPDDGQILVFLEDALNQTSAFKAVQSTASFLRQHTQNNKVLLTQVNYAVREASLGEHYTSWLRQVLKVFDERPFSSSGRNPEARQCAEIWHRWKAVLDEIDGAGGENNDGALAKVMALGRMDPDAVWHACWRWVYLEVRKPDEELEYGLVARFIGKHMLTLYTEHPLYASFACEHGFREWRNDERNDVDGPYKKYDESIVQRMIKTAHDLQLPFTRYLDSLLPISSYHDHHTNNGRRLMRW